jgi:hypothetical protein
MHRWLLGFAALAASAAVTRVELVERTDYLEGRSFGDAGPYELIRAKAFFAADPNLAPNKLVVDLHLAPRNEAGLVEWSADLWVLKPRDPAKGNGTLLYEVSNRGNIGILRQFHRAHDQMLLERGFTIVLCGWQWDIPADFLDGLRLYAPIATDNGKPIRGTVRAEWVPMARGTRMPLGDRNHVAYAPVGGLKLTVRDAPDAPRREIPASAWKLSADKQSIEMEAGFEPGRFYEAIYTAEGPRVAGLGLASARDVVSFFKYGGGGHLLSAERRFLKRAIGFGTSQSGRYLRKFLYDGFNADEKGRQVFDAVWAHVAGAGLGSFNHRFAQASRDGHPWMNSYYPTDIEPFDDEALLKKSREQNVVPKLFFTDGSYEYWGRASALTHTRTAGDADLPLAAESRRYFLAGTQHGAMDFPPRTTGDVQYPYNSVDYRFAMRGLLIALHNWLATGKEPPPSAYPLLARSELTDFRAFAFPVPGVKPPRRPKHGYRLNFGPEFAAAGIVTKEPPEVLAEFPVLVPAVDADGNETSGLRLPQVAVPLAAYTGWNYRTAQAGAAGEMADMIGATFPFPKARVAALYAGKDDYLAKTLAAGRALVKQGYVLEEDLIEMLERAAKQWDGFAKMAR